MQTDSVNIMCIYWVGDFRGRDFCDEDVVRLRETVDKHIDRPYKFYCLTNKMDADIPAEKIPLSHPNEWPGWWAKIDLHRPDLPSGRILYLDLDIHIIRSLQPILDFEGDMVMFTPTHKYKNPRRDKELGIIRRYQAAVMLYDSGVTSWVYDRFCEDAEHLMEVYRSEQDIMGEWLPEYPMFPAKWMTKLATLCRNPHTNTKDTIIITGQPSFTSFRNPDEVPWLEKLAR